jgi:cytidine deaminase
MIRTKHISFTFEEFESIEELHKDDAELVLSARTIALNAYAPYSKFRVGASVRLESGLMVHGTNVENAAFPSGICAERSALSNSISNHHNDKPVALAIVALTDEGETEDPVPPCGNCRQVIAEEELRTGNKIRIILAGKNRIFVIKDIGCLLPLQFNKKNLKFSLPGQ